MARGSIYDFTNKYGFSGGESLEGRDFRARDKLVELFNENQGFKDNQYRAVPFDRPGMHNACLILFVGPEAEGKSDEEVISLLGRREMQELAQGVALSALVPDEQEIIDTEHDLITQAYDSVDD